MMIPIIQNSGHIPDYTFELVDDVVFIRPRPEFAKAFEQKKIPRAVDQIKLKTETYERAREFAKGWSVYEIEIDWRQMIADKQMPDNPDGAFIGYVKWYAQKHGAAPRSGYAT